MIKLCSIGIHKFNTWSEIVEGYSGLVQFRECSSCKVIKYRAIYGNQVRSGTINSLLAKARNGGTIYETSRSKT